MGDYVEEEFARRVKEAARWILTDVRKEALSHKEEQGHVRIDDDTIFHKFGFPIFVLGKTTSEGEALYNQLAAYKGYEIMLLRRIDFICYGVYDIWFSPYFKEEEK